MCGVETPQDKGVKDDFSIVAIPPVFFASLKMTIALRCHDHDHTRLAD
jgi:hypothetical protein